jgi:hypothetical protein
MDEDNNRNALRRLLEQRCLGMDFSDDDIGRLVKARFVTEIVLRAADRQFLYEVFPGQHGMVAVLLKTFANPAGMFPCQGFAMLTLMFFTDLYATDL